MNLAAKATKKRKEREGLKIFAVFAPLSVLCVQKNKGRKNPVKNFIVYQSLTKAPPKKHPQILGGHFSQTYLRTPKNKLGTG